VELLDLGLAAGHEITAFVRSPGKIARADPRLRIVQGDPRSAEEIERALPGHDAVLSALGPAPWQALTRTTLLRDCAESTLAAMQRTGVKRFVVVASALHFRGGGLLAGFIRWLMKSHYLDLGAMEALVKATPLDWTIARPPRLVNTRDEDYRAAIDALPPGRFIAAKLSWRAVAKFMLDSLGDGRFVRQTVGICR
jgi:putative NADH-flavin reductase